MQVIVQQGSTKAHAAGGFQKQESQLVRIDWLSRQVQPASSLSEQKPPLGHLNSSVTLEAKPFFCLLFVYIFCYVGEALQ